MDRKEYEYSFKVPSLTPYLKFCEENDYKKIEENKQTRTLYRNENKTMARITIKEKNNEIIKQLDFKDDIVNDNVLIERRETLPILITDDEAIQSVLIFLGYKEDTILKRTRIIYKKGNVAFELDDYESPEVMYVVAVEGEKDEVDSVYNIIKEI